MSDETGLTGPEQAPASGEPPKSLVILLHGLGADGNDLIGLAPYIAQVLPDAHIISPDAPYPCDMAPYGRQWFSLLDRDPMAIERGVEQTAPILQKFIETQMNRFALSAGQVALVGFSQGTMMSLYIAPRQVAAFKAVVGFSGRLVKGHALPEEAKSKPPILLIHGDSDDVVPVEETINAGVQLEQNGFSVETLICPGVPHSIDQNGLNRSLQFLAQHLG